MKILGWLASLVFRSRFDGLLISPSPLVDDGHVVLKNAGRVVSMGVLSELRRHPKGCDEIVVSPSDWHAIRSGSIA